MPLFSKISLVLFLCFACSLSIEGKDRDVILCLDETGSMGGEKFKTLVYAIQLTASLLDETDRLYIIRGGGRETIEINLSNKKQEIETKIRQKITGRRSGADCEVLNPAYALLQKAPPNREKVLIMYGDGVWSTCGVENQIVDFFKQKSQLKPKIIFFKIEDSKDLNATSVLERNLAGVPPSAFEIYRTPADDVRAIKDNLFKLSKSLIDADPSKINPTISSGKISFTSKFPLKKLLFIIQKENCILSSSDLAILDDIEVSNKEVDGSLAGKYYEIAYANKSIIPANKLMNFTLDCPIDIKDIDIIPIVAMELETKVDGNLRDQEETKKEYVLCDREKEVKLSVLLTDDAGNTMNLPELKGIKLTASDGGSAQKMTISGNRATAIIKLTQAVTYLTVEAQYDGYFQKKSKIITIRREPCPYDLEVKITGNTNPQNTSEKHIEVCEQVKELQVEAIVKDASGTQKNFADLGNVSIEVNTGKKTFTLTNQTNLALGDLPLDGTLMEVTFTLIVDGKTESISSGHIIRPVSCGPMLDSTALDFGEMPLMDFVREGRCLNEITLNIVGTNTILNPRDYTLKISNVPPELKITIDTSGQFFSICIEKRKYLCDCFVRHGTFSGSIIAVPKEEGKFIGIEKKWTFTILPEKNFFVRAKTCLLIALFLAIALWYFWGVWTKPRFYGSARFHFVEEDRNRRYGSNPEDEYYLNKASFFSRYLIPYVPENKIIGDDGLLIIASTRKDIVYLSKKSFTEKMKVNGASPDEDARHDEAISENDTIRIGKTNAISVKYTFQIN